MSNNSFEVRKKFFDFFIERGHTKVASSPVIPAQDPTILFTNAGMNQFKDLFLGKEKRSYTRAVSIQKCIRAGGKHNDLENVGFTKRHLTFFEMLGNFSFGDYFKKDAIIFAWDFLTKVVNLDPNKLYATVFLKDDDAYNIWKDVINLPESRISRLGAADNFWQMGDTGPCGPCSEIYVDRGSQFGCQDQDCKPGCSCDRFLEIWNLVFMEFNRQSDGTDLPLAQTGIDTGMGLERLMAILENKDSVFETDLFMPIISKIEELTKINYASASKDIRAAFRVLADHIRSSSTAIADGCTPSNEGRGYVLRKIIRRAALFAQKLGSQDIFPKLVPTFVDLLGPIYPELKDRQKLIQDTLTSEIDRFKASLVNGQNILDVYFKQNQNSKIISGEEAFKLYDTYGFPLEVTKLIALDNGFAVDIEGFEKNMEAQRAQSGKKTISKEACKLESEINTDFTGYAEHITKATIKAIVIDNKEVSNASVGDMAYIITDKSPFYVECGGQISDQGYIEFNGHQAKLLDLKKFESKAGSGIGALIEVSTNLKIGDVITQVVDSPARVDTMKNHTATHLLQAALISILGKEVKQAGSVVTPDYLRFDFSYSNSISLDQITQIEDLVNKKVMENIPLCVEQSTLQEATKKGVIAFFGEKYNPEKVRVVQVPGFSAELCGGTHVNATGDIGAFKITELNTLAAGTKRIVALTGPKAISLYQYCFNTLKTESLYFKVPVEKVAESLAEQKIEIKQEQVVVKDLKKEIYKLSKPVWISEIKEINGLPLLYLSLDANKYDSNLRAIASDLIAIKPGLYFLTMKDKNKAQFFGILSPEFANKFNFAEFTNWLRSKNLSGMVKDNFIQGGANAIPDSLREEIIVWIKANSK